MSYPKLNFKEVKEVVEWIRPAVEDEDWGYSFVFYEEDNPEVYDKILSLKKHYKNVLDANNIVVEYNDDISLHMYLRNKP
jgi:hypothetical protein